jgi:hypothetical protein
MPIKGQLVQRAIGIQIMTIQEREAREEMKTTTTVVSARANLARVSRMAP